jgi:hypothetical protein
MILIYSREKTERLAYTCNLLFDELLSEPCLITSDREDFELSDLPKINYSEERFINGLFLKPHPLLFETDIHQQNLSPIEFGSMRLFFESSPDSILPFDPLAFCFYLVSRYEEYLPFVPDEHQRFPASESILYKIVCGRNQSFRSSHDNWPPKFRKNTRNSGVNNQLTRFR